MATHRTQRQGDEVFCTVCHRRWADDEPAPTECVEQPTKKPTKKKKKKAIADR